VGQFSAFVDRRTIGRKAAASSHSDCVAERIGSASDRGSAPSRPSGEPTIHSPLHVKPGREPGLMLVLSSGPVFFRPSPRQTSLSKGDAKSRNARSLIGKTDRRDKRSWSGQAPAFSISLPGLKAPALWARLSCFMKELSPVGCDSLLRLA